MALALMPAPEPPLAPPWGGGCCGVGWGTGDVGLPGCRLAMATAEKLFAVAAAAIEGVDWALAQSSGGSADAEGALSPVPIADRDWGFISAKHNPV